MRLCGTYHGDILVWNHGNVGSMSLEEAFKQALFERIEDEYDVAVAAAAYAEYEMSGRKSRPISELWKELDL